MSEPSSRPPWEGSDATGVHRWPSTMAVADVRERVESTGRRFAHLDAGGLRTRVQLHAGLAAALEFPDWYGGNLDALHDSLRGVPVGSVLLVDGWGAPADAVPRTFRVAFGLLGARLLVLLRGPGPDDVLP